jgi:uncharacterized RDD family membrane protein YckC
MPFSLQKASIWKRISAYLFDSVVLGVLILGLFIASVSIARVDAYTAKLNDFRTQYATELNIDLNISKEDFQKMTDEEKKEYEEKYNLVNDKMAENKQVRELNVQIITRVLVSITLSVLIGDLVYYFIIPLFFKNGRSLGKKMFGLAVVRSNCVKASTPVLFIRSMIGIYGIETMFPIMLFIMRLLGLLGSLAFVVMALLGILQIVVIITSKTNSCIHDLLTDTVVVEFSSQKIYESETELLEAQKAYAAEKAAQPEQNAQ